MQLVSFERTNPPVTGEIKAPGDVKPLLERACYDCHSNQTVWPWYSRIAPGSWLMHRDVIEGRKELNFSEWASLYPRAPAEEAQRDGRRARRRGHAALVLLAAPPGREADPGGAGASGCLGEGAGERMNGTGP